MAPVLSWIEIAVPSTLMKLTIPISRAANDSSALLGMALTRLIAICGGSAAAAPSMMPPAVNRAENRHGQRVAGMVEIIVFKKRGYTSHVSPRC